MLVSALSRLNCIEGSCFEFTRLSGEKKLLVLALTLEGGGFMQKRSFPEDVILWLETNRCIFWGFNICVH